MSKKITAAITAVGGYVPEDRLTNFDLEKMVDTNDEWIRTRTGIEERRILKGEGKATSDMVVPAVKQLCEKRGISPEEIDCLIVGTVTPDLVFPSTANIACDKLGAKNAWGFDLSAACSGFIYALATGAQFIELHTGAYAERYDHKDARNLELQRLVAAARQAHGEGLLVNAGHGLNTRNLPLIHLVPHLVELNIGHHLVSRSIEIGLAGAVREMLAAMAGYPG